MNFSKRFVHSVTKKISSPLKLFGIDGSYSTALYSAAKNEKRLDNCFNSFKVLNDIINQNQIIRDFFMSVGLKKDARLQGIKEISKTFKFDTIMVRFLEVLAEFNRLKLIQQIFKKYNKLNNHFNNIAEVNVISSEKLDAGSLKKIHNCIFSSNYNTDKSQLEMKNIVNPEIIGGLIVEFKERIVDLSLKTRINDIKKTLESPL